MTDVCLFDRGNLDLPKSAAVLLPPWRRKRLDALRNPAARQESLAAGLLFAWAMARRGLSPLEPVEFTPSGKPVFPARQDIFFSLSHSGRFVMCAVSDQPVGVDVQQRRPVKLSVARRFHTQERDWLSRQPDDLQECAFFRLWTRKEAWVKAASRDRMLSLAETDVIHSLPGWFFRDYLPSPDYCAAVCAQRDDIPQAPVLAPREELLSVLSYKDKTTF